MALLYGRAGRLTATNGGFGPGQEIGRRAPVRMQPVNQDMGAGQPPRLVGLEICTGQVDHKASLAATQRARVCPAAA